jgi:hypothetical protein
MPTLRDSGVDRDLALKELTTSPVYRNLLVSDEGDLTAVQVLIEGDEESAALLEVRESLRLKALRGEITEPERLSWRRQRRHTIKHWSSWRLNEIAW